MKSPGGSIFPYYYKGGEIHCLKYGSKYKNEAKLMELMKQEEDFMIQINKKLKIWVDFYKTSITENILDEFIRQIRDLERYIDKLSVVGLSGFNIWRLKRKLKKSGIHKNITYYADPEEAKTWLVHDS
ncbi:hypothetical protein ACM1RC_01520 [Paenibacillus azoreducens]|uniref:hypothetical protein n=1 Tax=Paenibacillus azoreducens TaxID=116718 RepID=UPI0039F48C7D